MNVQYAIKDGDIYVLEVNPRASRTVPFVAKVIGIPVAKIAARIMAGESLASFALSPISFEPGRSKHIGVKEAVFPFARFPGVDTPVVIQVASFCYLSWNASRGWEGPNCAPFPLLLSTPVQNPTVPPVENPTDRRGDEPQIVAAS